MQESVGLETRLGDSNRMLMGYWSGLVADAYFASGPGYCIGSPCKPLQTMRAMCEVLMLRKRAALNPGLFLTRRMNEILFYLNSTFSLQKVRRFLEFDSYDFGNKAPAQAYLTARQQCNCIHQLPPVSPFSSPRTSANMHYRIEGYCLLVLLKSEP